MTAFTVPCLGEPRHDFASRRLHRRVDRRSPARAERHSLGAVLAVWSGACCRRQPDPALRGRECSRHRWLQPLHRPLYRDGVGAPGRSQRRIDPDGLPAGGHGAGASVRRATHASSHLSHREWATAAPQGGWNGARDVCRAITGTRRNVMERDRLQQRQTGCGECADRYESVRWHSGATARSAGRPAAIGTAPRTHWRDTSSPSGPRPPPE